MSYDHSKLRRGTILKDASYIRAARRKPVNIWHELARTIGILCLIGVLIGGLILVAFIWQWFGLGG